MAEGERLLWLQQYPPDPPPPDPGTNVVWEEFPDRGWNAATCRLSNWSGSETIWAASVVVQPVASYALGPDGQVLAPDRQPDPLTDDEATRGTPADQRGHDTVTPPMPGGGR